MYIYTYICIYIHTHIYVHVYMYEYGYCGCGWPQVFIPGPLGVVSQTKIHEGLMSHMGESCHVKGNILEEGIADAGGVRF